jgi:DNA-binding transcriptional ArsR family regulator
MSVKIMGLVWDTPLNSTAKLVMLALADHADHEGRNAYPSLALLARKTGLAQRTVRITLRSLENSGILSRDLPTPSRRTATYSFVIRSLVGGEEYDSPRNQNPPPPGITIRPPRNQNPPPPESRSSDPLLNRSVIRESEPAHPKPMTYAQSKEAIKKATANALKKMLPPTYPERGDER